MLLISIDGACRRNGKPDCVSAAGVFIQKFDNELNHLESCTLSNYEVQSTNQRGELLALLSALRFIKSTYDDANIVTDSEYIFKAMTNEWYRSWSNNGWNTSTGSEVKNKDLWISIVGEYMECMHRGLNIAFYHIKGHCIPFGTVTANTLLVRDNTGEKLKLAVQDKYDTVCKTSKKNNLLKANALSERNNGFMLTHERLKQFVVANVMADAIATRCVDLADSLMHKP